MQKVLQTGNSLAVVIPAQFIKDLGIRRGDNVNVVTLPEKSEMVVKFTQSKQLPLELSPKNKYKK